MNFIIADQNLRGPQSGHYPVYDALLADAAEAAGATALIASHIASSNLPGDRPLVPVFHWDYWQEVPYAVKKPRALDCMEKALREAEMMERNFALNPDDVVFFPNAGIVSALCAGLLAQRGKKPHFVLLFRRDYAEMCPTTEIRSLFHHAICSCFSAHRSIKLCTDSVHLSADYSNETRFLFFTLPIPVHPALSERPAPAEPGNPPVLAYLGTARTEKGYPRLVPLFQQWASQIFHGAVEFIVQHEYNVPGGEPLVVEARKLLENYPIQHIADSLSTEDYCAILRKTDILLLPYDRALYKSRTSGIFAEAVACGVPVVVPSGTWMSRTLALRGAGSRYHEDTAFVAAVENALSTLPALKKQAAASRLDFFKENNPAKLFEQIIEGRTL